MWQTSKCLCMNLAATKPPKNRRANGPRRVRTAHSTCFFLSSLRSFIPLVFCQHCFHSFSSSPSGMNSFIPPSIFSPRRPQKSGLGGAVDPPRLFFSPLYPRCFPGPSKLDFRHTSHLFVEVLRGKGSPLGSQKWPETGQGGHIIDTPLSAGAPRNHDFA